MKISGQNFKRVSLQFSSINERERSSLKIKKIKENVIMTEELKNTFEELKASIRAISAKVDKITEEEEKDTELLELVRDYYRRKEEREK